MRTTNGLFILWKRPLARIHNIAVDFRPNERNNSQWAGREIVAQEAEVADKQGIGERADMSDDLEMEEGDGRDLGEHGVGIVEIDSDTSDTSSQDEHDLLQIPDQGQSIDDWHSESISDRSTFRLGGT